MSSKKKVNRTKEEVQQIEELPQPAALLGRVMSILQQQETDFSELIELLSRNQVLVARMLRLINSGKHGLKSRVHTVKDAVALLGLINIKELVYSSICFDFFPADERLEWEHAYTSSLLAGQLVDYYDMRGESDLQLVALLHDIGKVLLRRTGVSSYHHILKKIHAEGTSLYKQDHSVLFCDHTDFGAWLLEDWQLPASITVPIFYHHMTNLPEQFADEAAMLRFIDWVDHSVRGSSVSEPNLGDSPLAEQLKADAGQWLASHESRLEALDGYVAGYEGVA